MKLKKGTFPADREKGTRRARELNTDGEAKIN